MTEERATITIYPDHLTNTWMARFHDDPDILELFGGDTIPTAFTLLMPWIDVCRAIERKNPGSRVRLVDLDGRTHEN